MRRTLGGTASYRHRTGLVRPGPSTAWCHVKTMQQLKENRNIRTIIEYTMCKQHLTRKKHNVPNYQRVKRLYNFSNRKIEKSLSCNTLLTRGIEKNPSTNLTGDWDTRGIVKNPSSNLTGDWDTCNFLCQGNRAKPLIHSRNKWEKIPLKRQHHQDDGYKRSKTGPESG